MKPVDQLCPHDPNNGVWSDCFRASLASLLELHAEQVPHFLHDGCETKVFSSRLQEFLQPIGFCLMEFDEWPLSSYLEEVCVKEIFHLISGPSPRFPDLWHTVVGRNGEIAFDPHPTRAGLAEGKRTFQFLIHLGV